MEWNIYIQAVFITCLFVILQVAFLCGISFIFRRLCK